MLLPLHYFFWSVAFHANLSANAEPRLAAQLRVASQLSLAHCKISVQLIAAVGLAAPQKKA